MVRTVRTPGLLAALLTAVMTLLLGLLPWAITDPAATGGQAALAAVAVLVALTVVTRRPALSPLVARPCHRSSPGTDPPARAPATTSRRRPPTGAR